MDDIDLSILKALQKNGRKKHNELSRKLKIAQSTVSERVRRMESRGMIKGYRAIIDSAKLGLKATAFISISLARHEADTIRQFEKQILEVPQIRACYHIAGRFDYLLQVITNDLDGLGNLVKNVIAKLPGQVTSETLVVFGEVKSDNGLPLPDSSEVLDIQ